jgi:hypothetical protein
MKVLKSLKTWGKELNSWKVLSFVWKAYCIKPSYGSVGQRWPASRRYLGAFMAAPTIISPLGQCPSMLEPSQGMDRGRRSSITYTIRWPAAISSVAIAFVMAVATHRCSLTSLTKPMAARGLRMRTYCPASDFEHCR